MKKIWLICMVLSLFPLGVSAEPENPKACEKATKALAKLFADWEGEIEYCETHFVDEFGGCDSLAKKINKLAAAKRVACKPKIEKEEARSQD